MATDIERLSVLIEANTKSYERAMARVEQRTAKAIRSSERSVSSLDRRLKGLAATARTFAAGLGIGIGATALAQLPSVFRDIVAETSNIGKVADKVGLTTERLQELRYAGELVGASANVVDMAMQRFTRRVAEAAAGAGELLPILKANNVALRNSDGTMRSQNDILNDYADLVQRAGSAQERNLLTYKAFDTEATVLVNLLKQGSAGMAENAREAHKLGGVLGDDLVRQTEAVDDAFTRLSTTISTNLKSAVLESISLWQQYDSALGRVQSSIESTLRKLAGPEVGRHAAIDSLRARLGGGNAVLGSFSTDISKLSDDYADFYNRIRGVQAITGPKTVIPQLGGRGSASREPEISAAQRVIQQLQFEEQQLGRTAEQQRLYNELKAAEVDINTEAGRKIEALVGQIQTETAAQQKLKDAIARSQQAGEDLGSSLADTLSGLISGAEDARQAFVKLALQIAQAAIKAQFTNAAPATTAGGGFFRGLIGSLVGGLSNVVPAFADGTPYVKQTGLALVHKGEGIIPANMNKTGAGGRSVTINQTFPITGAVSSKDVERMVARGSAASVEQVKRELPGWQVRSRTNGALG